MKDRYTSSNPPAAAADTTTDNGGLLQRYIRFILPHAVPAHSTAHGISNVAALHVKADDRPTTC